MNSPNESSTTDFSKILKKNSLFNGLTLQQLSQLSAMMRHRVLTAGEYVFHEGDEADELFFIVSGEVEIFKEDPETKIHHRLATLQEGASIGEMALLDGTARSASVCTLGDCELLSLRIDDLSANHHDEDLISSRIKINLGKQVATNLRNLNGTTVKVLQDQLAESKARVTAGIFIITTFVATCSYIFVWQIEAQFFPGKVSTSLLMVIAFIVFSTLFFRAAKNSGRTLAHYGLNTHNWKKAALEACLFSIPIMILAVFSKWLLIKFLPAMHDDELFEIMRKVELDPASTLIMVASYVFFCPFQEFVVRGAIQGSFEDFLTGKYKVLTAILMSNLIFSMMHLHMAAFFSLMVFMTGLVWGWLYSRQRTLIGVSLSHALCGTFAFLFVGFDTIFRIYGFKG